MDKEPLKMSTPRSARSMMKLSKPAPRKVSTEIIPQTKHMELTCAGDGLPVNKGSSVMLNTDKSTEKVEKNNIINKRASRGLKVEKPAPLKSSTTKRIEDIANSGLVRDNGRVQHRENLSHDVTKTAVSNLIINALSDLQIQQSKSDAGGQRKVRLMSQMSHDSGVGDMHSYSRQSSAFDSLSEYQDDLDWDCIDDNPEEPFTLGRDQLQCTSYAVNQTLPFNSLTTTANDLSVKRVSPKVRRQNVNQNNIRLPGVAECSEAGGHEMYNSANDIQRRRHSERGAKTNIDIHTSNKQRHQSFDGCYSALKNAQNTRYSDIPVAKPVSSTSEEWEDDLIDVSINDREGSEINNNEKVSALNMKSCPSLSDFKHCDDFIECDEAFSDIETTPKAVSCLTKFTDSKTESKLAPASLCDENGNIKPRVGKDRDIESMSQLMKRLSESLEYREKKNEADLNSSCTQISTDDGLSQSTQDEGFNEQEYIWELIEDLSGGVQAMNLEKKGDKSDKVLEKCLPSQFSVQEFSILPDNFAEIEAELKGLGEEMDKLDVVKNELSRPVSCSTKIPVVKDNSKACVLIIREPLSPYSTQEEIWKAEEGLPWGLYTAKGRRQMFKNCMICHQEEEKEEPQNHLIRYTASDLLEFGSSSLSRKSPEDWSPDSWSYMCSILPEVCLVEVSKYFDAALYNMERSYVVENHNVDEGKKSSSTKLYIRPSSGSQGNKRPDRNTTQTRGGGFGAPMRSLSQPATSSEDGFSGLRPRSSTPISECQSGSNPDDKSNAPSSLIGLSGGDTNTERLNLDSKCDIRVGKNGMLPLSSNKTDPYNTSNQTFRPNFTRSQSDPEGKLLSNALSGLGRNPRQFNTPLYSTGHTHSRYHGDTPDLILKPDLPEKCPW